MAGLGSKESSYLDMIRDAWLPISQQREVRQGMMATALGVFIVGVGGIALLKMPDIGPVFLGIFVLGWGLRTLWEQRDHWRAWRTIGGVHVEFPDGSLVAGETSELHIVIAPRAVGEITSATLTMYAKDSRGPAATGTPWTTGLTFDAPLPTPPALTAGTESRIVTLVALDPSAPPSHFDSDFVRQWFVIASMTLADGRHWRREYPLIVVPSGSASSYNASYVAGLSE